MPFVQPGRLDFAGFNPILTNISVAYIQDLSGIVSDKVFPNVPVTERSARYVTYDRSYWNRVEMKERAPATESAGANYTIESTPSYLVKVYALHRDIPDQIRAAAGGTIFNLDREATAFLTQQAMLKREIVWGTTYFGAGLWTTDQTGVAAAPGANQFLQWSDPSSSPIEDIRDGKRRVQERTGIRPNKLVVSRAVYDKLVDHPDIVGRLDRGQTTGPAIVLKDSLAALFELDEVLVMEAVYNSAVEGGTATSAFVAGKSALLIYAAPSPGLMTPSAGYTFSWSGYPGSGANGQSIMKIRHELIKSDRVEIEMGFDQKLVAADLGQFFATAVA